MIIEEEFEVECTGGTVLTGLFTGTGTLDILELVRVSPSGATGSFPHQDEAHLRAGSECFGLPPVLC